MDLINAIGAYSSVYPAEVSPTRRCIMTIARYPQTPGLIISSGKRRFIIHQLVGSGQRMLSSFLLALELEIRRRQTHAPEFINGLFLVVPGRFQR